tara:strand:- start:542 stop:886 length:345 start_codon:yes stop_codon:yes gene_type:complete
MNLENSIKNWVQYDNQIKAYNDKVKDIRNKKNTLGNNIVHYMQRNHPSHSTIQISDGKLKINSSITTSPISLKFLEESLKLYLQNDKQAQDILEFIKNRRETKSNTEIKRLYNN